MIFTPPTSHEIFDIVGFGEVMVEFFESTDMGSGKKYYEQSIGGDIYNTLYSSSLYKKRVSFVSSVGNDIFKEYLLETMSGFDVDTQNTYVDFDYYSGVYFIKVTPDDDRIIQSYRDKSAARYCLNDFSYDKILDFAKRSKIFFCSGITLAICERKDLLIKLFKDLHDAGIKIAYDTNVRPLLWDGNLKFEKETEERFLPYINILFITKKDSFAEISVETEEELLEYYSAYDIEHITVKDGKNGAFHYHPKLKEKIEVPAITTVAVIDTTGAGDAFNGGFLSGILDNKEVKECLQMGVNTASACIQVKGAINYTMKL